MKTTILLRTVTLVSALLGAETTEAFGQHYWRTDQGEGGLRVEVLKPYLKNEDESFLVGTTVLDGTYKVGSALYLEGSVPVARVSLSQGTDASSTRIGNPYLGIRMESANWPDGQA